MVATWKMNLTAKEKQLTDPTVHRLHQFARIINETCGFNQRLFKENEKYPLSLNVFYLIFSFGKLLRCILLY